MTSYKINTQKNQLSLLFTDEGQVEKYTHMQTQSESEQASEREIPFTFTTTKNKIQWDWIEDQMIKLLLPTEKE